jgi:hypothetical protein
MGQIFDRKNRNVERMRRCQRQLHILIGALDWSIVTRNPATLAMAMSAWCGYPIDIKPMSLRPQENGSVLLQKGRYIVGYAENLPQLLQQHTIIHELAHIARHVLEQERHGSSLGEIPTYFSTLDLDLIQSSLGYPITIEHHDFAPHKTEEELETDLLADLIRLHLERWTRTHDRHFLPAVDRWLEDARGKDGTS